MNICASDGHTYRSRCAVKRQQCLKQYEIGLIYPGVCTGKPIFILLFSEKFLSNDNSCLYLAMESMVKEYSQYEEEFLPPEEEVSFDDSVPLVPLDSSNKNRC